MSFGQGHDTPFGHGQQLCEILSRSNLAVRSYGPDMDLGYMCTVTLTLEIWSRNIIQIRLGSEELWPGHRFMVCVHRDLGDMTLGLGLDTPLGHEQQFCEILSRSNLAVRGYGPDTDFGYVCNVTLTLKIWSWVKVMIHLWVMDNNCVKYPIQTSGWEVMAWALCEQTDRQTDRVIPIYPPPQKKLCLLGDNKPFQQIYPHI